MDWWSGRTGIVLRRTGAVGFAALAALALAGWLLLSQARATVFDEGYLAGELERLESYELVTAEVYPALVEQALERRDERLPEVLGGLELPADETARRELLLLLETALPAEVLQRQAEGLLDGLMPYLRGEGEGFEFEPELGERLEALAGREGGRPSALESAFRELELGPLLVEHLAARYADEAFGGTSASLVPGGASVPIVAPLDAAEDGEWFTTELFAAVDELLPYLRGETESFAVAVDFEGREELAFPLAQLLRALPSQLIAEGYRFDEAELRAELALADDEALEDLDELRAALSPGWTVDERELLNLDEDPEAARGFEEGRDLMRTLLGPVRWGGLALALLLLAAVGFLGGRGWGSRLGWAGGAALGAAGVMIALVLVGYPVLVEPALHEGLLEGSAGWSEPWLHLRPRVVADLEDALGRLVRGVAWRAVPVAVVGAVTLAAGLALRRRVPTARPGEEPGEEPPLLHPRSSEAEPPEQLAA